MTKDKALRLALEALELHGAAYLHHELRYEEAITTAKEALAQPVQKPDIYPEEACDLGLEAVAYYTTPPAQRKWVGLTDEDLKFWTKELGQEELGRGVLRAVADHLKEKNT